MEFKYFYSKTYSKKQRTSLLLLFMLGATIFGGLQSYAMELESEPTALDRKTKVHENSLIVKQMAQNVAEDLRTELSQRTPPYHKSPEYYVTLTGQLEKLLHAGMTEEQQKIILHNLLSIPSNPLEKREELVKQACKYFMMKSCDQDANSAKIIAIGQAIIHMQQKEKEHAERQSAQESIRERLGVDPRLWEELEKYHTS
ncbi:MAG: hypothetical protein B7Y25_04860 [Alphaproteobacteria bacterium 16-39-46]|nr:MAG: hypothetical protein B7Y25_04860 [Alphaproteobacteria bacterium 16-39-46]OZA42872.1 MAG: hypothetical protein B7X84_04805 [Alphaproteobacteria bacterium 17-39-52]HQS84260.1 hypothetical protein [Alphaproteobacteria bacterium]HQS94088.1 hypothetical protein [Alphaproteobacteria bacterium]